MWRSTERHIVGCSEHLSHNLLFFSTFIVYFFSSLPLLNFSSPLLLFISIFLHLYFSSSLFLFISISLLLSSISLLLYFSSSLLLLYSCVIFLSFVFLIFQFLFEITVVSNRSKISTSSDLCTEVMVVVCLSLSPFLSVDLSVCIFFGTVSLIRRSWSLLQATLLPEDAT